MRHTCHGCEHLRCNRTEFMNIWYCDKNKEQFVVPHHQKSDQDEVVTTFWRVPAEFCQLSDTEVKKRPQDKKAPEKYWVTVKEAR